MINTAYKARNGEQLLVRFANYAGLAGIQERNGKKFAAFFPSTADPIGNACMINGRAHKIVNSAPSSSVSGMLVVEVEDIHDAS